MRRYFINHKEVTFPEYIKSEEEDLLEFDANNRFMFDKDNRLIKVNDKWV